jgi:DNA-binding transcriptional LysR family regulator
MFDLRQLECFVAVAAELNFHRAAARLNMTQPPLSRQIQLLEHQVGTQLLERSKGLVRLTAAGRIFQPEAQDLLHRARLAALSARRIARGEAGSVSMGFVAGAIYDYLPRLVTAMRGQLATIDLILKELNTFEQIEALTSHRIDLGLVRPPFEPRALESQQVVSEPFVLALPRDHELAQQKQLTLKMLDRRPFIMYSPSDWQPFYELLAGAFRSARIQPDYVQLIGATHTILALVNTGMGIALVPESAQNLHFDNVVFRAIRNNQSLRAELFLVWRQDNDNPAVGLVRQLVVSQCN